LVDSPPPIETTGQHYRFKQTVRAGQSVRFVVKEEVVESETLMLLPADLGQVELYSRTGEIPREVREVLTKAAIMKGAIIDQQRNIQEKQRELGEIRQEQERIRANLGATTKGTAYHDRLLKKLNEQETRIEQVQNDAEQFRQALLQQQRELEKFLANTSVGDR
jgi:septal ring factor EnvC (AmiA/AmiB activator)